MKQLIKSVAEVIADLQTLNLLEKKNVTTTVKLDEESLTVTVIVAEEVLHLCLEMFKSLRDYGYVMSVKENNRNDPSNSILTVVLKDE